MHMITSMSLRSLVLVNSSITKSCGATSKRHQSTAVNADAKVASVVDILICLSVKKRVLPSVLITSKSDAFSHSLSLA